MLRILAVDDSKSVHAFVKECLKDVPCAIQSAYNGQEGVDAFEKGGFDLVIMDWEMPVMDGPTAVRSIRGKNAEVPILMLTSRNSVEDITRMLEEGASEYMLKPFTQDILVEKVSLALGRPIGS